MRFNVSSPPIEPEALAEIAFSQLPSAFCLKNRLAPQAQDAFFHFMG